MQFILKKNRFLKEDGKYYACPINTRMNNFDDLMKEISGPGSILKKTEINAVIDSYWSNIITYIINGEGYADEYIKLNLKLKGTFEGDQDHFDPRRHQVEVNINPNLKLKEACQEVKPIAKNGKVVHPYIQEVYDYSSDTINQTLTPRGVLRIKGTDLKTFKHPEGQGVFFKNTASGELTEVENIYTNKPKTLDIMIPQLDKGTYQLQVRNTAKKGRQIRISISDLLLAVK